MESLTKLAATAIKQLQVENTELKEQLDKSQEAIKLAFDLYHTGIIAAEEVEFKIKEYSSKSQHELEVIRKAGEFTKTASNLNSFKLSTSSNFEQIKPEDRFISFLVEDL